MTVFPHFRACCARRVSTRDGGECETSVFFVISSGIAVLVCWSALEGALFGCACVCCGLGRLKITKPTRGAPRVSTATSGRERAHGERLLVVPDATPRASASHATRTGSEARASACVRALRTPRPRQRQLHRPAARPARSRGRSTPNSVFPDMLHRARAHAHPSRAPKLDARVPTPPCPRVCTFGRRLMNR